MFDHIFSFPKKKKKKKKKTFSEEQLVYDFKDCLCVECSSFNLITNF